MAAVPAPTFDLKALSEWISRENISPELVTVSGRQCVDTAALVAFLPALDATLTAIEQNPLLSLDERLNIFSQFFAQGHTDIYFQPRDSMTPDRQKVIDSVEASGIREAVKVVRVTPPLPELPEAVYELIDGHTRGLGVVQAMLTNTADALQRFSYIPVNLVEHATEAEVLGLMGSANMLRVNYTDGDCVRLIRRMLERGMERDAIIQAIALSHPRHNSAIVRLFNLVENAPALATAIEEQKVSLVAAEAIASHTKDETEQDRLADDIAIAAAQEAARIQAENKAKKAAEAKSTDETRGRKSEGGRARDIAAQAETVAISNVLGNEATSKNNQAIIGFREGYNILMQSYADVLDILGTLYTGSFVSHRLMDMDQFVTDNLSESLKHILNFHIAESTLFLAARVMKANPRRVLVADHKLSLQFLGAYPPDDAPAPPDDYVKMLESLQSRDSYLLGLLLAVRSMLTADARRTTTVTVNNRKLQLLVVEEKGWAAIGIPLTSLEAGATPVAVISPVPVAEEAPAEAPADKKPRGRRPKPTEDATAEAPAEKKPRAKKPKATTEAKHPQLAQMDEDEESVLGAPQTPDPSALEGLTTGDFESPE